MLDGYLIFGRRDGTLYAVRYDPGKLRSLADAVPVVSGVAWRGAGGIAASLSRDGSLAYVRGGNATQLVVTDESGTKTVATSEWQKLVEQNNLTPQFMRSRDCAKYLESEYIATKAAMSDLGLAR